MTIARDSLAKNERPAKKTILIVEDDEGIRRLLKEILALKTQYCIVFSCTGAQAVKAIKELNPSLFVLNYNLPDTNGIALYDQLHALQRLENVPALILSARIPDGVADEIKSRNIEFLQKPFKIIELLRVIEHLAG